MSWDGLSDLREYLLSKRSVNEKKEIVYEHMRVWYEGAPNNSSCLGSSYVNKLMQRAEGVNIAERCAMLDFLFAEVPATRTQLSPELFVLYNQPRLLE